MYKKRLLKICLFLMVLLLATTIFWKNNEGSVLANKSYQVAAVDFNYLPLIFEDSNSPTPSPTHTSTPTPTPTSRPIETQIPPGVIVVNRHSIDLFDQIPNEYIQAAANLDMMFVDRSVGENISEGLDCLSYSSNGVAPSHCVRSHTNPLYDLPIETWDQSYDRSNWDFYFWGTGCSSWSEKVGCFFDMADGVINQNDVLSFQFSYLLVDTGSTIANQPGGYFWDNENLNDVYDHEAYETLHSDKIFIYWTTSLARTIGTDVSDTFNNQMRQYAIENDKVLFDVADILSHLPDGTPCYDNQDGNNLAICPHYTTEINGGHLGSVSKGKILVAKAFWVLMAQIAGWDGIVR